VLVFTDCEILKATIFDTSRVNKQHINVEQDAQKNFVDIIDLVTDFEMLKLDVIHCEEPFIYELHGIASSIMH
jgi:hypothetical protein